MASKSSPSSKTKTTETAPSEAGADMAAATEGDGSGHTLEVKGRVCEFPPKVPPGIAAALQMERLDLFYKILSGGNEELLEHLIVFADEDDLKAIGALYGVTLGE